MSSSTQHSTEASPATESAFTPVITILNDALVSIPSTTSRAKLVTVEGSAIEAMHKAKRQMMGLELLQALTGVNDAFSALISVQQDQQENEESVPSLFPLMEQSRQDEHTACELLGQVHNLSSKKWAELARTADQEESILRQTSHTLDSVIKVDFPAITSVSQLQSLDESCRETVLETIDKADVLLVHAGMCDELDAELQEEANENKDGNEHEHDQDQDQQQEQQDSDDLEGHRVIYFRELTNDDWEPLKQSITRFAEAAEAARLELLQKEAETGE